MKNIHQLEASDPPFLDNLLRISHQHIPHSESSSESLNIGNKNIDSQKSGLIIHLHALDLQISPAQMRVNRMQFHWEHMLLHAFILLYHPQRILSA